MIHLVVYTVTALIMLFEVKRHGPFEENWTFFIPLMSVLFQHTILSAFIQYWADPVGRAVWGVGLRPLACRDSGFESRRGMHVCLLWKLCVVRRRFMRTSDHSSKGVLPSVKCLSMISKLKQWESLGQSGLSSDEKQLFSTYSFVGTNTVAFLATITKDSR